MPKIFGEMRRILCIIGILLLALFPQCVWAQIYAENLMVKDSSSNYRGLPKWAFHRCNLPLTTNDSLADRVAKQNVIKLLKKTDNVISSVSSVYEDEISDDYISRNSFLADINHDGKPDFVFYGMMPFCDHQPFVFIAFNEDSIFREIFGREGDILGWEESNDIVHVQVLTDGCCEDKHGYLYSYSSTGSDTFTTHVFWQNNAEHPEWIVLNDDTVIIEKDCVVLLPNPAPQDSRQNDILHSRYWFSFKGDTGKLLYKKTIDNSTWYYVQMPVVQEREGLYWPKADYVYGWIPSIEVSLKKSNNSPVILSSP